ncbi:MAG: hypothetical protein AAFO99_09785 [Bacteroidota bacterium]
MKLPGRIFNFYLDASVHVALAVYALLQLTSYFLNISIDAHLGYFIFFSTMACYNFIKYGVEAKKYILVANRYHKSIQFVSFIVLGIAVYHSFFFSVNTWIAVIVLMGLTGFYAMPILPQAKNLRSLGGLKIFLVALVWAGTTVLLPFIAADRQMHWDVWTEALQRFILILVLMIPFEIRDLAYDAPELRTLPQRYGIDVTKKIGVLGAFVFFMLTFLKDDVSQIEMISKALLFFFLGLLVLVTKKQQSTYFSSFWIEGLPIVWWVIVGTLYATV